MQTLSNLKWVVIGLCFLVLGIYASAQRDVARRLEHDLLACQNQRAVYETNLKQLQYLSIEQDHKIDVAEAEIEKLTKEYGDKVEALRGAKVPIKCSEAVTWVKKNKGSITWSK